MGLFTRDCYDEDRDARIKEIGLVAYEKEIVEYEKKYREEHPEQYRWSISEPKVIYGDVIAIWDAVQQKALDEAVVRDISENGEITVNYLDCRNDGQPAIWKGGYKRLSSTIGEY